ncbi:hypothetical protein L6R29_21635 [Myxococcota bacterium]|nr:hypothetical protein [Myxococcota bacterium]
MTDKELLKKIEALELANDALAEENLILKDALEGVENENVAIKAALRTVSSGIRKLADDIDHALERLEGKEFH